MKADRPLIGRRACADCRSDNELLITCADGGARCPACCVRAGWCVDCGGRIRSVVLAQARCFFCGSMGAQEWKELAG